MEERKDIRWIQRFQNFEKAFKLLKEVVDVDYDILNNESIVKEGIVQRFQYTFELAWKTLKDKLENDGVLIERISPKYVIKKAFQLKYINEVELWLSMANDRNLMSHTYDLQTFDEVLENLQKKYFSQIEKLYNLFVDEQ